MQWVRGVLCGCVLSSAWLSAGAQVLPPLPPTVLPTTQPTTQSPGQPNTQFSAQPGLPPGAQLPTAARPFAAPATDTSVVSRASNRSTQTSAQRARVEYTGRALRVSANDSSLNQILREVGRITGMKITGGVTEERVFGTFGPDEPAAVLAALLSGTGSNMLLVEDVRRNPVELVLTSRQGGPSLPSPSAAFADAGGDDDLPPGPARRVQRLPLPGAEPVPAPLAAGPGPAPAPDPAPTPAGGTTTQQSPNGVGTPQQVYEQLMKLHQQQPNQPPQ